MRTLSLAALRTAAAFIIVFVPALSRAYVPKEGNVYALTGPFLFRTEYAGSDTGATSPNMGGWALLANGDINDRGSLELGFFHMNKIFYREVEGRTIAEATEMLHSTAGYRHWVSPWVSISAALFASYTIGDPWYVHSDFAPGDEPVTSARDITEYGFDFSVQTDVWTEGRYSVVLDTRYSWNVTPKVGESANHYGALVLLRYFVQEKQVVHGSGP